MRSRLPLRTISIVLFRKEFWPGIRSGEVTLAFRRWKRLGVVPGRPYRTPAGRIEVIDVREIETDDIPAADARRAGYTDAAGVLADLRPDPSLPLYRIEFRILDEPDPRTVLAGDADLTDEDVAEIDRRLDRLDARSSTGPWAIQALRLIDQRPAVRAGDLAEAMGLDRAPFKLAVRKLKEVGLTESLRVGYRLSPRGRAYLERTNRRPPPTN